MASLAILIGLYSYLILALGLLGWLYKLPVFLVSLPFLIFGLLKLRKLDLKKLLESFSKETKGDKLILLSLILLSFQVLINLAGALSPELSFDALFYHLPPPKLYIAFHRIFHIPGGLLFVSALPRLTEMLYTVALLFGSEIWAKLIHFTFGILSAIALFKLLKHFLSLRLSVLGVLTFYTMLVVGWQSTTAYVDLARTFFEILALFYFLRWVEEKKESFLTEAGVMTGLAISSKILAFTSFFTFLFLILVLRRKKFLKPAAKFSLFSILTVFPWLFLTYINTHSPLFPIVAGPQNPSVIGGLTFFDLLKEHLFKIPVFLWKATLAPDDIISPIFLLFLPLVLIFIWKQKLIIKLATVYFLTAVFITPLESTRYLLPYLPALTLVTFSVVGTVQTRKKLLEKVFIFLIFFGAVLNLGSRGLATRKFLPYLLGRQSKEEFLIKNLNFSFGDFYDVDGWFAKNIDKNDLVLIYNIHNLYYVDFPFVHESWAKPGTFFTHILVGDNQSLPKKFGKRILIYQNSTTGVRLYLFGEALK